MDGKNQEAEKWAEEILRQKPFGLEQEKKEDMYCQAMKSFTEYHRLRCDSYRKILDILGYQAEKTAALKDVPMLPVSLFKDFSLSSIEKEEVFKTLTSSATTGQTPSSIVLDSRTASLQQQVLFQIVSDFIGKKRMPMLILDTGEIFRNRNLFSARGAGAMGFSIFSSDRCLGLDENMNLDIDKIEGFLEKHKGKPILVFGFTYIVWEKVYKTLKETGKKLDLSNGYLIHGGGWKKLQDRAVSSEQFAKGLYETCKIAQMSNYYGMAEQTGTIYMECEYDHLHVSSYSEILVRDMRDFSLKKKGEEGVIQVMSPIAFSYPGHSLLTEDRGYILGADDCPCGRKGKYFKVTGRIAKAEIRGCGDTYGK